MKADEFYELCKTNGACEPGLAFIKGKTSQRAWKEIDNPCWLAWVIEALGEGSGMKGARQVLYSGELGAHVDTYEVMYTDGGCFRNASQPTPREVELCDRIRARISMPRRLR